MVEVIGKAKEKLKKVTCNDCASILRYTEREVTVRQYSCCGSLENGRFITCPECNNWVEVGY